MSTVIEFIKDIANLIVTLVKFAIKFVEDIVYIIKILGDVVIALPDYLGFFPSAIGSLIMLCISVVVVYKVVGRD